jgi:hypothetical protein
MRTQKNKPELEKVKSILIITLGFLLLFILFKKPVLLYISLGVGTVSLMSPIMMEFVLLIWDKIALILGWINTRILLAAIFYLFLLPIALLTRLTARNLLQLKNTGGSVFNTRNHTYTKEDLENTW